MIISMDDLILKIKEKINIKDIAEEYLELKLKGKHYVGLCPFHDEKTLSFTVYPKSNSFYCFGCGTEGDVIDFVSKINGISYTNAIEMLASRVGISLSKEIITGFFEIEDILNANNGNGKLIAIASRPGMGKSTFAVNLISNIVSLNNCNVLLFSLEIGKEKVKERIKKSGLLTENEIERIYIDDTPKIDIDYIEKNISKYDNLSAVFIDYIQLVKGFKYSCEREEFLLKLKKICIDKNIHIIYTYQLSRSLEKRIDKRPVLLDVDTATLKNTDAIFAIYRRAYYLAELEDEYITIDWKKVELICLKNSFGDLFKLDLNFSGNDLTYSYDYSEYDAVLESRNELHLHTKLSDDVSVIGVEEIFEKTQKLGFKSIAFTNLNNVQGFPEIMRKSKRYENIKAIYGVEVQ